MAWGKANIGGGSSGGIIFKVISSNTEEPPICNQENTIWVKTDKKITNWVIDTKKPETAPEGTLYLMAANTGTVSINIMEENQIIIAFIGQFFLYSENKWNLLTGAIYKDKQWHNFTRDLLKEKWTNSGSGGLNHSVSQDKETGKISVYFRTDPFHGTATGSSVLQLTTPPGEGTYRLNVKGTCSTSGMYGGKFSFLVDNQTVLKDNRKNFSFTAYVPAGKATLKFTYYTESPTYGPDDTGKLSVSVDEMTLFG